MYKRIFKFRFSLGNFLSRSICTAAIFDRNFNKLVEKQALLPKLKSLTGKIPLIQYLKAICAPKTEGTGH